MTTTVKAAIFSERGQAPRVGEVTLPEPGPGQVRVRLSAAGACHSDLSLSNGTLAQPMPAVLGHEGAGTVEEVGPGVDTVRPGQRVVLNWAPPCRSCWFCGNDEPHLCEHAADAGQTPYAQLSDGSPVYAGLGTGAFAEATVVAANGVVALPDGVELGVASLLGCAMLTGWGAVTKSATVAAGESVAVVGLGGVGMATLQAARLAGADPVIAVDLSSSKEGLARELGATHFLTSGDALSKEIRALTGGRGVDHAFEVVGTSATIRSAWGVTRRGGTTTVVGIGARDDLVNFSALELFHFARTLRGCVYGSADPARDVPVLAAHVRDGDINLANMVTDEIGLDDVPAAFARMRDGMGVRSLIRFE